jgi:septum site-determining protein MinC
MAVVTRKNTPSSLELKSAVLTLTALVIKSADLAELARELDAQAREMPGLFDNDPVLIDLGAVRESSAELDVVTLLALLRRHRLLPLAVRGGSARQMAAAREAGLAEAPDEAPTAHQRPAASRPVEPLRDGTDVNLDDELTRARQLFATMPTPGPNTLVIDRPLRSGQQVYARGADLVVLAMVSHGAEVIADGSIHVYAPLRGRAVAGAKGHTDARIYSTCMEAQLISIAGTYRTTEVPLPANVLGKPAQVRLDGDRLVVEPIKA